jgi:hypothetical protein
VYFYESDYKKGAHNREILNSVPVLNGNEKSSETIVDSISLNNLDGLASFKRLMDTYIIPRLKREFKDDPDVSAFVRDITEGSIHNKNLDCLQVFYRPSFDLSKASKNPALDLKYKSISNAFNILSKKIVPDNWGINTTETT